MNIGRFSVLLLSIITLTFLFGFEVGSNREKMTYDLYQFTEGTIGLMKIRLL
jgi:hypothetical protein